jgi:hypothetical protein
MKASSIVIKNVNVDSMVFQVINDCVHIVEAAIVTVLAGAVVAVGKVAQSCRDIDIMTPSDMVNEVLCACSSSRAKAAATFITTFIPAHFQDKELGVKEESVVLQRVDVFN